MPAGPNGVVNVFPGAETIYSGQPSSFHYVLGLTVRGVWDDNIFISHTHRVSDYFFAIEPYISLGVGDMEGRNKSYLRLDYMPSVILYTDHSNQDGFMADYQLTGKVYLQGEFDSWIYNYPNHISSYTIAGGLYIYYQWLPKLSVGIGGTFGYEWVDDPTANQPFEQVNVRLNYQVTNKFFLYASAGVEFRQFDGDRGDYISPVFEVGSIWYPFSGTTLTLAAGRRVYSSGYLPDQDFGATYVVGRFQQRVFHRVYLGLTAGYENDNYIATDRDVSADRNDDYWFIEPSVDVLITRWLSAGAYYLHREDISSDAFFSWYDNQVGVRATLRF